VRMLAACVSFLVATCCSDYPANTHFDACFAFVHEAADHRIVVTENGPELAQPRSLVRFRSTTTAFRFGSFPRKARSGLEFRCIVLSR